MKNEFTTAVMAGILTLGLVACGGGKSGESAGNTAPAQKAAAPAAPAGGAEFGVPECDEYIAKYTACVESKVPDAARGMVRQQIDASKAAWKQAASTPEGRAGLALTCKQATEAAKAAVQAYGCSW